MKPINNPQDQKKAAALLVGVIAVFGFVGFRVMSTINGAQAPQGPTTEVVASGSAAAGTALDAGAVSSAASAPEPELIDVPPVSAADIRNPFHTDSGANIFVAPPPAMSVSQPIQRSPHARRLPTFDSPPMIPPNSTEPPVLRSDPDPMQVMGVSGGQNPVAVIRVGAQTYVVNRGERFGHDNLLLKEVSETQVVIEEGNELHILRVGARPPAPSGATPPPASSSPPQSLTSQQLPLSGQIGTY